MLLALLPLLSGPAHAGTVQRAIDAAPAVVWAGVDYSHARFFVPETFDDAEVKHAFDPGGGLDDAVRRYSRPKDAWDELTGEWNTMLQNLVVDDLEKGLKRDVTVDLPAPAGQTRRSAPYWESQYDGKNAPRALDEEKVAATVKGYRLKTRKGIGLAFIVEKMDKLGKEGCVWTTWFDLSDKSVVRTDRECEAPGGVGFRNYWLRPVLDVAKELTKKAKNGIL